MQNKPIIETDEGFKAFEPHELPDGCIVSFCDCYGDGRYFSSTYKSKVYFNNDIFKLSNDICFDIKLHDIIDESGNRTHHLRYMTTGRTRRTFITAYKPIKKETGYYDQGCLLKEIGKNICGQTWEDEPWEVWEKIK